MIERPRWRVRSTVVAVRTPSNMPSAMADKMSRDQFLDRIAEAVNTFRIDNNDEPNVLVLSPSDLGLLESAYSELYNRSECFLAGNIRSIVFFGRRLMVAVSFALERGQVQVGRTVAA